MNVAIVDIGSNSVRFSIYNADKQTHTFSYLVNERYMIGLIGFVKDKILSSDGIDILCKTILTINSILKDYAVKKEDFYVFATASLRNLNNTNTVIDTVKTSTDVTINIISGDKEAFYSFLGATMENDNAPITSHNDQKTGVVVDVGGGSTEVIYYDKSKKTIISNYSECLGSLSLKCKFCKDTIPTYDEYKEISKFANSILSSHNNYISNIITGVGGTCKNLFTIAKTYYPNYIDNDRLDVIVVDDILNMIKENHALECEAFLTKIVPDRVETMFTGLMILKQLITVTKAKYIVMTDFGVKEGYLIFNYFIKG